jgi:hypothetical protein
MNSSQSRVREATPPQSNQRRGEIPFSRSVAPALAHERGSVGVNPHSRINRGCSRLADSDAALCAVVQGEYYERLGKPGMLRVFSMFSRVSVSWCYLGARRCQDSSPSAQTATRNFHTSAFFCTFWSRSSRSKAK